MPFSFSGGDHLRSNLGIISGLVDHLRSGIICGAVQPDLLLLEQNCVQVMTWTTPNFSLKSQSAIFVLKISLVLVTGKYIHDLKIWG